MHVACFVDVFHEIHTSRKSATPAALFYRPCSTSSTRCFDVFRPVGFPAISSHVHVMAKETRRTRGMEEAEDAWKNKHKGGKVQEKTAALLQKHRRSLREGYEVLDSHVRDVAASKDIGEARAKVKVFWRNVDLRKPMAILGRVLVCLYFFNLVLQDWQLWRFYRSHEMQFRLSKLPNAKEYVKKFPFLGIILVLPSATMVLFNYKVPVFATILVIDMLKDSSMMIWNQTVSFVTKGWRPNELMLKKMAMLGCSALVLANGVKESKRNTYAGKLLAEDKKVDSKKKSAALLAGRLMMTALFAFIGYGQVRRVISRDFAIWFRHKDDHQFMDGHDNNWLLLEFALSIPFAFGYKMASTTRLLASTLVLEAFTCWAFWSSQIKNWQYAFHAQLHFVVNLSCAGGLLILQSLGAGRYTVDNLIKKKE